jgi:hypothetical protein
VTRELRDHIRAARDAQIRQGRAFEDVCHHCLAALPEGGDPRKRFCGHNCRNANYSFRIKRGLAAPGGREQTVAERAARLEARRRTWREAARRRYAAKQGVTLDAWDAGKVAA